MKIVEVSAAVIIEKNRIYVTQRGYGDFKGLWEFPGGKIEINESKEDAVKRELYEELKINSEVLDYIGLVEYDYEKFHLKMYLLKVKIVDSTPILIEHMNNAWVDINDIDKFIKNDDQNMKFLPADVDAFIKIKQYLDIGIKNNNG